MKLYKESLSGGRLGWWMGQTNTPFPQEASVHVPCETKFWLAGQPMEQLAVGNFMPPFLNPLALQSCVVCAAKCPKPGKLATE